MKYSIIIPCYKIADKVEQLFQMMHSDSYADYEVVFVDDCSNDNTFSELNKCKKQYDNYVVVQTNSNGGPGVARNKGLDIANGKYIIFVDSDDRFDINVLYKFDTLLAEDVDLIVSPYTVLTKNGEKTVDDYTNVYNDNNIDLNQIAMDKGTLWNKVFKKSVIDKYNIRMPKRMTGEDKCFVITYLSKINKAVKCSDFYYSYVMNDASVTHNKKIAAEKTTTFEELQTIYHNSFPKVEEQMFVNDHLLTHAKILTADKKSNKFIKNWYKNANKQYPNWIKEIDYNEQGIYRKLIYKAMYNANPYMIKFIMWIRGILY